MRGTPEIVFGPPLEVGSVVALEEVEGLFVQLLEFVLVPQADVCGCLVVGWLPRVEIPASKIVKRPRSGEVPTWVPAKLLTSSTFLRHIFARYVVGLLACPSTQ